MEFLNDLISASSSTQLETIISKLDPNLIVELEQKSAIVAKLVEILENEFIANNAKIRRRIKRCIQSFEIISDKKVTDSKQPPQMHGDLKDLKNVVQALYRAVTVNHVQVALDSVIVPEKLNSGEHSIEFLEHRAPLKAALEHVLLDETRTNKVLRKRIKRLVFVLSTKEEQTMITATIKHEIKKVIIKPINKLEESAVVNGKSKSFSDCFAELTCATSPLEVENAISDVSVLNSSPNDVGDRMAVQAKLVDLIANHKELVGNAKVRRMASRLVDSLAKFLSEPPKETDKISIKSSVYAADKWNIENGVQLRNEIKVANDFKEIGKKILIAPKSILHEQVVASDGLAISGGPLEPVIVKVRSVASAVELEEALLDVKPDSGNCSTRRTLKRSIERLLTQDNIKESINAKIRRRIARVIGMLEPQAHSERDNKTAKYSNAVVISTGDVKELTAPLIKIPYVVFIGQLNFTSTEQDIEQHLRTHGVEGDISVRLLKKTDTNESRGMAFVELEGARELHKCIALHHSRLQGRVVNVEKSCGGKNKTMRAEKIGEKRREQMLKVHESVDKVLLEFHEKGVLDVDTLGGEFKDKIHRYTPGFVAECLKIYSNVPAEKRSLGSLDQIFTSKDERVRLGSGAKRGVDIFDDFATTKKQRVDGLPLSEDLWPPSHPVGFSDNEHKSGLVSVEKGGNELRLDQVFSSKRGGRGLSS